MKKLLLTTLLLNVLILHAQPFEKNYPYFFEAYGDHVFVHSNGFTLAGLGMSSRGYALFLIHTDLNGDTLWTKNLDYGIKSLGQVRCVTDGDDNHYISFFNADSANLVKFSPDWQEVWRKKFDDFLRVYQLYLDSDNNLLISATGDSTCLIKLGNDGNLIWQSVPFGSNGRITATAITESQSGNIVLFTRSSGDFGYTFPNNIIRVFSSEGEMVDSGYVSPDPIYSCGVFCSRRFDDHLLSLCNNGRGKNYLVHHGPDGTILQQKEIMLPITESGLYNFIFNNTGGITTIGNSISGNMIMQGLSLNGDSLWTRVRNYSGINFPYSIALCQDGGYAISGGVEINGMFQPYLLRTDPWGGNSPMDIASPEPQEGLLVYPNPAVDKIVFESREPLSGTLLITDLSGRRIAEQPVSGTKTVWFTGKTAPGIYLYRISCSGKTFTGRLVVAE